MGEFLLQRCKRNQRPRPPSLAPSGNSPRRSMGEGPHSQEPRCTIRKLRRRRSTVAQIQVSPTQGRRPGWRGSKTRGRAPDASVSHQENAPVKQGSGERRHESTENFRREKFFVLSFADVPGGVWLLADVGKVTRPAGRNILPSSRLQAEL